MPSDGPETAAFRVYDPAVDPFGADGYPVAWHTLKHVVRELAGHRCIRCGHPYRTKSVGGVYSWVEINGENALVSPCDAGCHHGGPIFVEHGSTTVMAPWRILTVHHLDQNKAHCRWWNLVALCQRCHLVIQRKVDMGRTYIRPHSEWFKPYAAAHYAFKYLGQDLTWAEVDARLDELLALELREEPLFT